jgi:hypothetical protein
VRKRDGSCRPSSVDQLLARQFGIDASALPGPPRVPDGRGKPQLGREKPPFDKGDFSLRQLCTGRALPWEPGRNSDTDFGFACTVVAGRPVSSLTDLQRWRLRRQQAGGLGLCQAASRAIESARIWLPLPSR